MLTEIFFGIAFEFLKNFCTDFGRRELFTANFEAGRTIAHLNDFERHVFRFIDALAVFHTDETLCAEDGIFVVHRRLTTCKLTDDRFAFVVESNDRRRRAIAFFVRDDFRFCTFQNRYTRVRRTKVNTNNFCHNHFS